MGICAILLNILEDILSQKNNDPCVSAEEFELLSELVLDMPASESKSVSEKSSGVEFDIGGRSGKDALLFQLGLADDLQLIANYGRHHLVFPVQMKMGDFANFSLSLKSPKVFEKGEHLRAWRLDADNTMALVNDTGKELNYKIKDISASGLSVVIEDSLHFEFPEELNNIYLQLPNREKLLISASKIRRLDEKSVAYSFGDGTDDEVLSLIAEYLFERHAEKHPEAHVQKFSSIS